MTTPSLTQEQVLALFEYRDGELYWRERPRSDFKTDITYLQWNPKHAGKRAGCYSGPYVTTRIDNVPHSLQRIIFLMHHGYLPEIVDHADCNPKNNKIENLRAATKADNQRNQPLPRHNTSGHKGVVWHKAGQKWLARIKHAGRSIHLGSFKNIEDAVKVATLAREKYHGEFARSR